MYFAFCPFPNNLFFFFSLFLQSFDSEMQRMGAPLSVFRQSELNTQFQFCESLPRKLLVPKTLPDSHLEAISRFRAKARIPLLTYFHKVIFEDQDENDILLLLLLLCVVERMQYRNNTSAVTMDDIIKRRRREKCLLP